MTLNDYVKKYEPSVEAFTRKVGVGRTTMWRLLAGRPASLRVAKAVSAASGGRVTVMALLEGAE
jgi:hypothetical protein